MPLRPQSYTALPLNLASEMHTTSAAGSPLRPRDERCHRILQASARVTASSKLPLGSEPVLSHRAQSSHGGIRHSHGSPRCFRAAGQILPMVNTQVTFDFSNPYISPLSQGFVGFVFRQRLCINFSVSKSKFPNHFAFTLGRYLFMLFLVQFI